MVIDSDKIKTETIFKWLEVNNKLTSVCELGILKILLSSPNHTQQAFKFISDSSRIEIELDTNGNDILNFIKLIAQRRLGDDCQMVENGSKSPDLTTVLINNKLFNFVQNK